MNFAARYIRRGGAYPFAVPKNWFGEEFVATDGYIGLHEACRYSTESVEICVWFPIKF